MTRRVLSLATIINRKGWAFDGVHNSYTVALVVWRSPPCSPASTPASGPSTESTDATRSPSSPSATPTPATTPGGIFDDTHTQEPVVAIYPGPAQSLDHFEAAAADGPEKVAVTEFLGWSNTAAFPQIPTEAAFKVWRKIKSHPRFDGEDLRERERRLPAVAVPGGPGGPQRQHGPPPVPQRRWAFRAVAEFHATHDRDRYMKDDGAAAKAATGVPGSGSLSQRPQPPHAGSTGSATTEQPPPAATRASGPSTTASPSTSGPPTQATTTTPATQKP